MGALMDTHVQLVHIATEAYMDVWRQMYTAVSNQILHAQAVGKTYSY